MSSATPQNPIKSLLSGLALDAQLIGSGDVICSLLVYDSYSTAKSAFATIALICLGQKYGHSVSDLFIKEFVSKSNKLKPMCS